MPDQPATPTSSSSPASVEQARPAPPASSSRMLVLLALLGVMIGWYAYDFFVAKPGTVKANDAIQALADERNKQGIKSENGASLGDGRVTSTDIQKVVGRAPYSTKKEKNYTIETYWWYSMPHRNYITVLYVGNDPRRYNTHYLNAQPDPEDLPGDMEILPPSTGPGEALEGTSISEGGPAGSDTDKAKDAPADETAPAKDKSGEEKPAEEKPAEEKPAEEKP